MLVELPARSPIPKTNVYVELIKKKDSSNINQSLTMLVLPGGPGGDHTLYNEQIDHLTNFVNIILLDPRGCGKSAAVQSEAEYHMDVYIDRLLEVYNPDKLRLAPQQHLQQPWRRLLQPLYLLPRHQN